MRVESAEMRAISFISIGTSGRGVSIGPVSSSLSENGREAGGGIFLEGSALLCARALKDGIDVKLVK